MDTQEREELLGFLADMVDDDEVGRILRNVVHAPISQVVDTLSGLERRPGLGPDTWNAIVTFKAWLGGKKTRDDVYILIQRIQGMM